MNEIPPPPSVGKHVRMWRKRHKMSLDSLAKLSGVSKAMLSQIETEKANPTVATVWKIAHALGLDVDTIITGEKKQRRKFEVTRNGEHPALKTKAKGVTIQVLSPVDAMESHELYLLSFESGAVLDSLPHHSGTEEYLTVLEGKLELVAGDRTSSLERFDFAAYECDIGHRIRNVDESPAKAHLVVKFK